MSARPLAFESGYFDDAVNNLPVIIEEAQTALADVDFDTLVGTGFSGGIVIPMLADALGKSFVLIRKENDDSHHGGGRLVGNLGERWIFVDDFVSSGATRRRVLDKIADAVEHHWRNSGRDRRDWRGEVLETADPLAPVYVGDYLYRGEPQRFRPACAREGCTDRAELSYEDPTVCYDHQDWDLINGLPGSRERSDHV